MHKARVNTIQALLAGSVIATSATGPTVQAELAAIHQAGRIRNANRRRILEILHSARALDSSLKTFIQIHNCPEPGKSLPNTMGGCLHALEKHVRGHIGNLNAIQRTAFQAQIVSKRNTYLHEAGTFPMSDGEVDALLGDIGTCFATVLSL